MTLPKLATITAVLLLGLFIQSCGEEDIPGCTNAAADNYDPSATMDNGTCTISGCTDPEAENYDPNANVNSTDCVYARDKFIGIYTGTLDCGLLNQLNTDSAEIEITIVPDDINKVSITIKSGNLESDFELPLDAEVNGDELSLSAEDFPYQVDLLGMPVDVLITAEGTVSTADGGMTLTGSFTANVLSMETGDPLLSDQCQINAVKN